MIKNKILIVDDEKLIRWSLKQKLSDRDLKVFLAEDGEKAFSIFKDESPDLVLLDVNLPDKKGTEILRELKSLSPETPVIMITAFGSIDDAVKAIKLGAYDFLTKPLNFPKLERSLNNALETASLKRKVAYYAEKEQFDLSHIIAHSNAMKDILEMTKTVALSETTIVLIQGESGTGKDLLAQAIHHISSRKSFAYLPINCSAIPDNLLESELFGHEKGAFTDAKHQKKGQAELAHRGTLFLDEISTLNLHLQAKILRFLETQTFKRVGGLKDIEVDIRVIAATNQDLESAIKENKFRKDLFYRLNICPIMIPPLRERREDILPLANHFVQQYNLKFRKNIRGISKKAKELIWNYEWPGNVRELKNAIERAMIFEKADLISTSHLPIGLNHKSPSKNRLSSLPAQDNLSLVEAEKTLLIKSLHKTKGNISKAAKLLKITRDTLRYRIKKWDIRPEDYSQTG